MKKNPWAITEEAARARDAKAAADERNECVAAFLRVYVPGMPDYLLRRRLAERGFGPHRLSRVIIAAPEEIPFE